MVVNPYCDSYRLRYLNGEPSVIVSRVGGSALDNWRDFALCFDCHNRYEVIGDTPADVCSTNFWNDDTSDANSTGSIWGWIILSLWIQTLITRKILCVSVYCMPQCAWRYREVMIRHGELVSFRQVRQGMCLGSFLLLCSGEWSGDSYLHTNISRRNL